MVGRGDGIHPFAVELFEVRSGHRATVVLECGQHLFGDRALVKRRGAAAGDFFVRPREIRIPEEFARDGNAPGGQEGLRRRRVGAKHFLAVLPVHADHFTHGEPRFGVADRRREYLRKRLATETAEQFGPAVDRTRHRGRVNTALRHRGESLGEQIVGRQRFRRPTGGIESVQFSRLRFIVNGKQVAADAVVHWGDESHHSIGRDRCIHRVATVFENRRAHLRRQHTLARDNPVCGCDSRARL